MPGMDGFALAERITQIPNFVGATVMMLTSGGSAAMLHGAAKLGIAAYLTKADPPGRNSGRSHPASVLGMQKQQPQTELSHGTPCARRGGTPAYPSRRRQRRSIAKLAVRMLEKRGHTVIVAENGRQALAAVERPRNHSTWC